MPVDVLDDSDVAARPVGIASEIDSDAAIHPVDIALEIDSDDNVCARTLPERSMTRNSWSR